MLRRRVSQASAELHHALLDRQFFNATFGFGTAFFGIWWAWVNFAWFSSGQDTDDVPYRLFTLVQMAGVLVCAAGIHDSFANYDFTTVVVGYAVMRLGLTAMWFRVARDQPAHRTRALRYVVGVTALQALWIARLGLSDHRNVCRDVALRSAQIGHSTIIVLGEGILSATVAIREAIDAVGLAFDVLMVAGASLVIVCTVWWAHFGREDVPSVDKFNGAFIWGYGHLPIFAGLAAFGSMPIAVASAGFTFVGATTRTPAERSAASRGIAVIATVVALGLVASLEVALVGTALVLVIGTIVQGVALGRRVGLAESAS